jgi:endonuclease III-like uncharacterized protein
MDNELKPLPNEAAVLQAVAVVSSIVERAATRGESDWWAVLKDVITRRPEPPRREAEQFMSAILSTRAHYEAALASAKKLRDRRIYELTEIAYLASLREDMKALDALTPAKGKEIKP